jgi:hypothetical protein
MTVRNACKKCVDVGPRRNDAAALPPALCAPCIVKGLHAS